MLSQIIEDCDQRIHKYLDNLSQPPRTLTLRGVRQPDGAAITGCSLIENCGAKPRVFERCSFFYDPLFCRTVPGAIGQRILFEAPLRIPVPAGSQKLWKPRSLPATRPLRKFPRPDKRTSSRTLRYKFSALPSPPRRYGAFGVQSETYAIS